MAQPILNYLSTIGNYFVGRRGEIPFSQQVEKQTDLFGVGPIPRADGLCFSDPSLEDDHAASPSALVSAKQWAAVAEQREIEKWMAAITNRNPRERSVWQKQFDNCQKVLSEAENYGVSKAVGEGNLNTEQLKQRRQVMTAALNQVVRLTHALQQAIIYDAQPEHLDVTRGNIQELLTQVGQHLQGMPVDLASLASGQWCRQMRQSLDSASAVLARIPTQAGLATTYKLTPPSIFTKVTHAVGKGLRYGFEVITLARWQAWFHRTATLRVLEWRLGGGWPRAAAFVLYALTIGLVLDFIPFVIAKTADVVASVLGSPVTHTREFLAGVGIIAAGVAAAFLVLFGLSNPIGWGLLALAALLSPILYPSYRKYHDPQKQFAAWNPEENKDFDYTLALAKKLAPLLEHLPEKFPGVPAKAYLAELEAIIAASESGISDKGERLQFKQRVADIQADMAAVQKEAPAAAKSPLLSISTPSRPSISILAPPSVSQRRESKALPVLGVKDPFFPVVCHQIQYWEELAGRARVRFDKAQLRGDAAAMRFALDQMHRMHAAIENACTRLSPAENDNPAKFTLEIRDNLQTEIAEREKALNSTPGAQAFPSQLTQPLTPEQATLLLRQEEPWKIPITAWIALEQYVQARYISTEVEKADLVGIRDRLIKQQELLERARYVLPYDIDVPDINTVIADILFRIMEKPGIRTTGHSPDLDNGYDEDEAFLKRVFPPQPAGASPLIIQITPALDAKSQPVVGGKPPQLASNMDFLAVPGVSSGSTSVSSSSSSLAASSSSSLSSASSSSSSRDRMVVDAKTLVSLDQNPGKANAAVLDFEKQYGSEETRLAATNWLLKMPHGPTRARCYAFILLDYPPVTVRPMLVMFNENIAGHLAAIPAETAAAVCAKLFLRPEQAQKSAIEKALDGDKLRTFLAITPHLLAFVKNPSMLPALTGVCQALIGYAKDKSHHELAAFTSKDGFIPKLAQVLCELAKAKPPETVERRNIILLFAENLENPVIRKLNEALVMEVGKIEAGNVLFSSFRDDAVDKQVDHVLMRTTSQQQALQDQSEEVADPLVPDPSLLQAGPRAGDTKQQQSPPGSPFFSRSRSPSPSSPSLESLFTDVFIHQNRLTSLFGQWHTYQNPPAGEREEAKLSPSERLQNLRGQLVLEQNQLAEFIRQLLEGEDPARTEMLLQDNSGHEFTLLNAAQVLKTSADGLLWDVTFELGRLAQLSQSSATGPVSRLRASSLPARFDPSALPVSPGSLGAFGRGPLATPPRSPVDEGPDEPEDELGRDANADGGKLQ